MKWDYKNNYHHHKHDDRRTCRVKAKNDMKVKINSPLVSLKIYMHIPFCFGVIAFSIYAPFVLLELKKARRRVLNWKRFLLIIEKMQSFK